MTLVLTVIERIEQVTNISKKTYCVKERCSDIVILWLFKSVIGSRTQSDHIKWRILYQ